MNIILADSAGFCFGVKRAVETAYSLANTQHDDMIFSYGDIIHNNDVLNSLAKKGISVIDSLDALIEGNRVIIRAHGVGKDIYDELEKKNVQIIDMTCPFVKKIHSIVNKYHKESYKVVIVGDKNHPEVIGINGWCENTACIVYDDIDENIFDNMSKVCLVAQTTITRQKWNEVIGLLTNKVKHVLINDTICNATDARQNEAIDIAKKVDLMFIIGSTISSNTQKLLEVCSKFCDRSYLVENKEYLKSIMDKINFDNVELIGVTAGASTPQDTIDSVINYLNYKGEKTI